MPVSLDRADATATLSTDSVMPSKAVSFKGLPESEPEIEPQASPSSPSGLDIGNSQGENG